MLAQIKAGRARRVQVNVKTVWTCQHDRHSYANNVLWVSVFPNSAVAIILQKYENRISTYCCNSLAVIEGSDVPLCYDNTSTFQLPDAQVIPGRIALQNYTSVSESTATVSTTPSSTTSSSIDFTASTTNVHTSATTTSCSEMSDMSACKTGNHNVQIGVGVGVPLAAAAIAAVAWALWERRKRMGLKQQSAPAPVELSDQHPHHKPWGADITLQSPHSRYQSGTPSELGSGI